MATTTTIKTTTDLYDALTLELEHTLALVEHIAERLSDLSAKGPHSRELYALSLVAQDVRNRHTWIIDKATALLSSGAR